MALTGRYQFLGSCVELDGDAINAMKETGREIALSTFVSKVGHMEWLALKGQLGYGKLYKIELDWHVSYALSTYQGRPCAYLTHSAIEYVFAGR